MNDQLSKMLSVCIFGKNCLSTIEDCIRGAGELTDKVFFLDLGSDDQSKAKASELGAFVANLDSFKTALKTDWVLFLNPAEKPVLLSEKKFKEMLLNKQVPGYGVHTKSTKTIDLLENYRWIKKLGQFKKVGNSDYVAKVEPRLVRKPYAEACLDGLANKGTGDISWICGNIVQGIAIESILCEKPGIQDSVREHDLRCLKGELVYDATVEEDMVELSEMYTGFRILTRSQLDGFMEGARCGFGHYKMYIPMLDFLLKEGFFTEARGLFEQWIDHRPDDKEEYNTHLMGGMIYANLLELDKAIEWFKRITEKSESALAFANLGKLYLIKGEKNKAIEHLEMSKDIDGDIFLKKRILSIITNEEWRPLKLSLCMIARDEEDQIGKALQSVDGLVDEIIVVDTGSKDNTREIVRGFGAELIETEWEDDFSKARNRAVHEATGDYILFMDADEFIHPTDRFGLALFKMLLPIEKNIAFGLKIAPAKEARKMSMAQSDLLTDQKEDDYQIRIFPRKPGIQFQGKVFESLDETLNEKQVHTLRYDTVKITHSVEGREKRDRKKIPAIARSFDSILDPQKILKAGILFLRLGELDLALPWLMRVQNMDPQLFSKIGMLYSRRNKPEMAKEILVKALERCPESPEIILSLAGACYKEENYSEVANLLGEHIEKIDKDLTSEEAALARYYLGIASIETGDVAYGIEQLVIAHEKNPANICYKIAGIYAFARVEQWEEALQVAGKIADEEEIDIRGEVNDFMDVGQIFVNFNRHFIKKGQMEEASLCQKIIESIITTKISKREDIQRMSAVIEAANL